MQTFSVLQDRDADFIVTTSGLGRSLKDRNQLSSDSSVTLAQPEPLDMAPDGNWLIGGFEDGKLVVWDLIQEAPVGSFAEHPGITVLRLVAGWYPAGFSASSKDP